MWIWKCLQRMVYFSEKNLFEICIIFQWLAAKNENAWISNYFHAVSIKRYHKRKLLMTQKLISGISFCLFEFSIGVFAMHSIKSPQCHFRKTSYIELMKSKRWIASKIGLLCEHSNGILCIILINHLIFSIW